jgi:glutathione synthase/RimK-type ligase-like ATP-grasp enzyme
VEKNTKKKSILLIGFDSNLSLGVSFCLKSTDYNLFLLTHNPKNAGRYSRFIKRTFQYTHADNVTNKIIDLVKEHHIDLIMPIDEMEIRNVSENLALLSKHAACTLVTETKFFDIGINKSKLANFLAENNLPCPKFTPVDDLNQVEEIAEKFGYPVLLKPVRGSFGRGIQKFHDYSSLKIFLESSQASDTEFMLQPYITGRDITVNVICKNGTMLCHTLQETPIKYGENFKSGDILEFHNDKGIVDVIAKMMALLNWNGVACIDMKRDQRDQSAYILEINGRFWASMVSSYLKAGINFPLIMAKLGLGESPNIPLQKDAFQISLKNYVSQKLKGNKVSFKDTKYISYIADPIARIMQLINS